MPAILSPATAMSTCGGSCQSAPGVSARPALSSKVVPAGIGSSDIATHLLLLWLDVGGPDHLGPFLGLSGNERPEIGRRAGNEHAAEIGELGFELGIVKSGIDLAIELIDDRGRRIRGRAEAEKCARLIARHELTHAGKVRQPLRAGGGGYAQ